MARGWMTRWWPALVLAAQLGSCAVAPTLVLRPALAVFTACDRGARVGAPEALCTPAGQGARDPGGWLLALALAVLALSLVAWCWPLARLVGPRAAADRAGATVDG